MYELEADRRHAQLVLRDCPEGRSSADAKRVIESSGVRVLRAVRLPTNGILFLLDTEDMREIVLELTERGYLVEGINALTYAHAPPGTG